MFPLIAGLVSGGASLLGSIFSSETSASNTQAQIAAQQQTNQMSAAEAQKNRDFQAQMSNTAYQRASQDMEKAGLNPAMMFGSGSAASSPGGSMASFGTPNVMGKTSPLAGLGEAVQKSVSTAVDMKTMDVMSQKIANLEADRMVTEQQKRLIGSKADSAGYEVTEAQAEAEKAKRYINMPAALKNAVEYTNYGASGVKSVGNAISSLIPSAKGVSSLLMDPQHPTKTYSGLGPTGTQTVKEMIDEAFENSAKMKAYMQGGH